MDSLGGEAPGDRVGDAAGEEAGPGSACGGVGRGWPGKGEGRAERGSFWAYWSVLRLPGQPICCDVTVQRLMIVSADVAASAVEVRLPTSPALSDHTRTVPLTEQCRELHRGTRAAGFALLRRLPGHSEPAAVCSTRRGRRSFHCRLGQRMIASARGGFPCRRKG